MSKYCITAANHSNKNNHCASSFKVWEYNDATGKWNSLGGKPINYVNDLLANGHTVLSAKENEKNLSLGKPIETELRIAKNETQYKVSDMPTF